MNKDLIDKIIKVNNETCPLFALENPLLDKNVARALSRSFVKILNISKQNSNINNNLRLSILQNIRKLCQTGPGGHVKVDEDLTELLSDYYNSQVAATTDGCESVEKKLDAFLMRQMKELNMNSKFESSLNPEVVLALINLNQHGLYLDTLSKDVIHWNTGNNLYASVLRDLWNNNVVTPNNVFDDISIKMKSEIEKIILEISYAILTKRDDNIESIMQSNQSLIELIKNAAISPACFQLCSGILNFIFIMVNFDPRLQAFIPLFIKNVKQERQEPIAVLYPVHLNNVVLMLDFDISILPTGLQNQYSKPAINYLAAIHQESENDLILVLSHYPQWFDVYFNDIQE